MYEHANFGGIALAVDTTNVEDLTKKTTLNDKISSVRVGPATTVNNFILLLLVYILSNFINYFIRSSFSSTLDTKARFLVRKTTFTYK